jgi:hypothetical protein
MLHASTTACDYISLSSCKTGWGYIMLVLLFFLSVIDVYLLLRGGRALRLLDRKRVVAPADEKKEQYNEMRKNGPRQEQKKGIKSTYWGIITVCFHFSASC